MTIDDICGRMRRKKTDYGVFKSLKVFKKFTKKLISEFEAADRGGWAETALRV